MIVHTVEVALGTIRLTTSTLDRDIVMLEVPRSCVALDPTAQEALRDAVTAHLAEFYARQPVTHPDEHVEPF